MPNDPKIEWPVLEAGYQDQYGCINPKVYETAASLWPQAANFARFALHDTEAAHSLLMKAAASVTHTINSARTDPIQNLSSYLFTSYKRLVIEEKRRQERLELVDPASLSEEVTWGENVVEEVERKILVKEIIQKMDPVMRETYEKLALGYSFREIAALRRESSSSVRMRFHRHLHQLIDKVKEEEKLLNQPGSKP